MIQRKFLSDQHARIPFSIIGVFLLLGSSVTAVYITRLELEKSKEIARSLDINEIENLLYYFEADLTNALNLAGMKALKEIGKHPVITSSIGSQPRNKSVSCERHHQRGIKRVPHRSLSLQYVLRWSLCYQRIA